jgi:N-carbamoyl-L-amino-acid hydrolase
VGTRVLLARGSSTHWLARECEELAHRIRASGEDVDITLGEFTTNSAAHGLTKVAGELSFSIDVRSSSSSVLERCRVFIVQLADRISQEREVTITLGDFAKSEPATMDPDLIALLDANAEAARHRDHALAERRRP